MCLNQARYGIAWGAVGVGDGRYDAALTLREGAHPVRGQPIACHQLVQEKLAWMITEITKAQLLACQLGQLKDAGRSSSRTRSRWPSATTSASPASAPLAREILGANGIIDEYPVIRHMLNLESVYTYEGTHDIHTLIIGEAITGIPAFNAPERSAPKAKKQEQQVEAGSVR